MAMSEHPIQLESYFDFIRDGDEKSDVRSIRLSGTRVGVEFILSEYLEGATADEIALRFPTLSLEQIYATITYYLADREFVSDYLRRVRQRMDQATHEQDKRPTPFVLALRERLQSEKRRTNLID
jgi:hypothetical protein